MIEHFTIVVGIAAGLVTIATSITYFATVTKNMRKGIKDIQEGVKCMLRSAMLSTYYKHIDDKELTQYEYQNFDMQYKAYKALEGNSFIDKIHDDIEENFHIVSQ